MNNNGTFNLEHYDISGEVGFLTPDPMNKLSPYFEPWTNLATNLQTLLKEKTLRHEVNKMEFLRDWESHLSSDEQTRKKELRLIYVYLTFIGCGYVWQEGEKDIAKDIPERLAKPWHDVSEQVGLRRVSCMASVALNNYQKIDPDKPLSLENIKTICAFPGSEWFFLITVQVELDAVKGIKAIPRAFAAVLNDDKKALKEAIEDIVDSLRQIKETSKRMGEHLDGDTFFLKVRPFLSGYGGEGTKIPDGLKFEGVSEEREQAIGGSAAQSSTIQSFDTTLGVHHNEDKQAYLTKVREYMPPRHAAFIEALANGPSIRDYVKASNDQSLEEVYDKAVQALVSFRDYHLHLVSQFILKPSNNIITEGDSDAQRGTGGTALTPFLIGLRESTKSSLFQRT